MSDEFWVLIVERREPGRHPTVSPWAYHDEVYGPFNSEAEAWEYAVSRGEDDADQAHDVQRVLSPVPSRP